MFRDEEPFQITSHPYVNWWSMVLKLVGILALVLTALVLNWTAELRTQVRELDGALQELQVPSRPVADGVDDRSLDDLAQLRHEQWRVLEPYLRSAVTITMGEDQLRFPLGRSEPEPTTENGRTIARLKQSTYEAVSTGLPLVQVEGHTDHTPIHTPLFQSNWELSCARALWVAKQLDRTLASQNLVRGRDFLVCAAGFGEYKPLDDPLFSANGEPRPMTLNRRIVVRFLRRDLRAERDRERLAPSSSSGVQ